MVEPFKNFFNAQVIQGMARHLVRVSPSFDGSGFCAFATHGLDELELKQRSNHICDGLEEFLPDDFPAAVEILIASLEPDTAHSLAAMDIGITENGIMGWALMPMADYVARHGQSHVALSLEALREMTMRASSEFAIRPFLHNHPEATLAALTRWCHDDNHHVRRLVSEGSRPRLPWGMRLAGFVTDPAPVIALLEALKDDPSEYVRRSVANNLNDIAKDHPDRVANIATTWQLDASPERTRLIRHGLRTLVKAGHPKALAALGYGPAEVSLDCFEVLTPTVKLGGVVEFAITLSSTIASDQSLIIDYAVHHMRANGKTSPKVFKWKTMSLKGKESLVGTRRHSIRPITTRRYYPGQHRVEILVNGSSLGEANFELLT